MTDEVEPERTVLAWRGKGSVSRSDYYANTSETEWFHISERSGKVKLWRESLVMQFDDASDAVTFANDHRDGFTYEAGIAEGKRQAISAVRQTMKQYGAGDVFSADNQNLPDDMNHDDANSAQALFQAIEAIASNEYSGGVS
jgi:hypothetical protein